MKLYWLHWSACPAASRTATSSLAFPRFIRTQPGTACPRETRKGSERRQRTRACPTLTHPALGFQIEDEWEESFFPTSFVLPRSPWPHFVKDTWVVVGLQYWHVAPPADHLLLHLRPSLFLLFSSSFLLLSGLGGGNPVFVAGGCKLMF